jgi:hypothetical protein
MKEHESYQIIIKAATKHGYALYRIEDGSYGKKPFDIGGCSPDGKAMAVEVKLVLGTYDDDKILPFGMLAEHQRNWLEAFATRGGIAWFILTWSSGCAIYRVENDWMSKPARQYKKYVVTWSGKDRLVVTWKEVKSKNAEIN